MDIKLISKKKSIILVILFVYMVSITVITLTDVYTNKWVLTSNYQDQLYDDGYNIANYLSKLIDL